jgi:hypothetical protein
MRFPPWVLIIATLLAAFPFGVALGLFAAFLMAGRNLGVLPALTVPFGIIVAIALASLPIRSPGKRLAIMVIGTAAMFAIMQIAG